MVTERQLLATASAFYAPVTCPLRHHPSASPLPPPAKVVLALRRPPHPTQGPGCCTPSPSYVSENQIGVSVHPGDLNSS